MMRLGYFVGVSFKPTPTFPPFFIFSVLVPLLDSSTLLRFALLGMTVT